MKSIPKVGESYEQCLARRRLEWSNNSKEINEKRRVEYQDVKDALNKKRREREALNRDKVRKLLRESYSRNSSSRRESAIYSHRKRKLRVPKWSERELIKQFYSNCPPGYEVDHFYPILGEKVSGLHVLGNLQYLTIEENRAKHNRYEP